MTRTTALQSLKDYRPGYCVVRWESRYGRPSWTIETVSHAGAIVPQYDASIIAYSTTED